MSGIEELEKMSFHDWEFKEILWFGSKGENLGIRLVFPLIKAKNRETRTSSAYLRFFYVTELKIEIDFENFYGFMSIYEVYFHKLAQDRWAVRFEFLGSPTGLIQFESNSIEVGLER